jgi:hypothetical protein
VAKAGVSIGVRSSISREPACHGDDDDRRPQRRRRWSGIFDIFD